MSNHRVPEPLSKHLRALEESLLQPDVRKSSQLATPLADQFIEFGTSGRTFTKQGQVDVLQAESPSIQTTDNFKLTMLAPTVTLLTHFIRHEDSPPGYSLRSSVWHQRSEGWQMAFHQSTRTSAQQLAA